MDLGQKALAATLDDIGGEHDKTQNAPDGTVLIVAITRLRLYPIYMAGHIDKRGVRQCGGLAAQGKQLIGLGQRSTGIQFIVRIL